MGRDNILNHGEILAIVRSRICLTPPGDTFPLHESSLSSEFNVSRTPIRQILQTLAREHLVELRPNVGAAVTQLDKTDRQGSFQMYQEFVGVSSRFCEGVSLREEAVMEIAAVAGILGSNPKLTTSLYVSLAIRVQTAIMSAVNDDILYDATLAAFWRVLRWRASDFEKSSEKQWCRFIESVRLVSLEARNGSASSLLRLTAGIVEKVAQGE